MWRNIKQFSVEVPINADGMVELFYKPDFECYNVDDFKIEHFSQAENDLLQNFITRVESLIPLLPLSNREGNWFIHAEDVRSALDICNDILKSCPEPEASAVRKLLVILNFAEAEFKPVHFFTEEAMQAILTQDCL